MKCEICGRSERELEEEFSREIRIVEHGEMYKCEKCLNEYLRELESAGVIDTLGRDNWGDDIPA